MQKEYIVGVDLGATNVKFGLINKDRIVLKRVLPTRSFTSKENLISGLCQNIKRILSMAGISKENILGIGFGLPGPIDSRKGIVHYFPNIKGWHNVALRRIIQKKMGLAVFIDNDANLMSLAEARLGAAKGKKNIVGITLGTGVGGGILVDGSLYRGSGLVAGELGHIPLNENGPKCNCGGIGCLERYIGNRYILENARKAFGKNISLEDLSLLANQGSGKAKKIWRGVAGHLGIALTAVVNFFNPDTIVIGGGVSSAGRIILDNVRKVIKVRAMPTHGKSVKVVKAKLGNDAGILGAGLLVKEELGKSRL